MPRPGPRPYECVRRPWHSDRHQPIRGSIIQQIFRVVTEAHSSVTRKNREWQEKLPRVVLKAEEIMYSKAKSEAEYVDPETLWERLNDAIDTIIRRDSTETGQFLQPCVEAALVLGCHPVRASRSQRNSNPRSYLNPRFQESAQEAPAIPDETNYPRPPPQPPNLVGSQLSISRSTMGNQASTSSLSSSQMAPNTSYIATHPNPYSQSSFPRPMPSVASEPNSLLNFGSIYPLYYGSNFQNVDPQIGFRSPQSSNSRNVIVGTPVGWHGTQPPCFTSTRNLVPGGSVETAADKHGQENSVDNRGKAAEMDCDLSLRLGPSCPGPSVEKGLGHLTSDGGSSSHRVISKYSEPCSKNLEFCFFPRQSGNDLSESLDNRPEQEGQVLERNAILRKRKAPDHIELDDERAQWLPEFQPNQFHGQYRWPENNSQMKLELPCTKEKCNKVIDAVFVGCEEIVFSQSYIPGQAVVLY
ncbi:uncharacterized protein LOC110707970 [Chenopodium quinoa]|uniref:uncharacterized protein LOC110707970 n=1 Tax=Chenopodium quinoa TaxID=63459 RepID=UPI000B77D5A1|nr:uncharacterized protein LOC110707970 [Chenopodium quinoa]